MDNNIEEIHLDDIFEYYADADKATRQAVSLLLEDHSVRWLVSTISKNRMQEAMKHPEDKTIPFGYGIYKAEAEYVPQIIGSALNPFNNSPQAQNVAIHSIASWVVQGGGHIMMKKIGEAMERILDR